MRKQLCLVLGLALGLTACKEKDEAYYLEHIDDAKAKMEQCEKDARSAMEAKDKDALEKLMAKGSECNLANNAIREHKRQEWEKEKQARQAQKAAEIAQEKAKLQQQYGEQSWQEFAKTFTNSACANRWDSKPECEAMKALYAEKTDPAIAQFSQQPLQDLLAQEAQYCKQDKRRYSACDVWQKGVELRATQDFEAMSLEELNKLKAYDNDYTKDQPNNAWRKVFKAKSEAYVEQLTQNYDQLKEVYNACVDRASSAKGWEQKYKVTGDYPCRQASYARTRLQLPSDDFKTKMD